jgi:hypothetical protein
MGEAHLDHPGEIHWFKSYGPSLVLGPCPHACPHNAQSVIAYGPSYERYELAQCDVPEHCDGGCRTWVDEHGRPRTAWLQVRDAERLLSRKVCRRTPTCPPAQPIGETT